MFRIYKGDSVIVEGESPLTITGIESNTDIEKGEYQAVRFEDGQESERVDIPAFQTLPIEVTGVSLTPKNNNLEVDNTRQLNAVLEPSDATNQEATYVSNDEAVATVDAEGLVTAIGEGETIITVETDDGSHTDTATVNVTEPEEGE